MKTTSSSTTNSNNSVFSTLKTLFVGGKEDDKKRHINKRKKNSKYCQTCPSNTTLTESQQRRKAQTSCEVCQTKLCLKCRKRCERCKRGVCCDCYASGFLSASICSKCDPEAVRLSKCDQFASDEEEGNEEEERENVEQDRENVLLNTATISSKNSDDKSKEGSNKRGLFRSISSMFKASSMMNVNGVSTDESNKEVTKAVAASTVSTMHTTATIPSTSTPSIPATTTITITTNTPRRRPINMMKYDLETEHDNRFHSSQDLRDIRFQHFALAFQDMIQRKYTSSTEKERIAQLRTMWFLLTETEKSRYDTTTNTNTNAATNSLMKPSSVEALSNVVAQSKTMMDTQRQWKGKELRNRAVSSTLSSSNDVVTLPSTAATGSGSNKKRAREAEDVDDGEDADATSTQKAPQQQQQQALMLMKSPIKSPATLNRSPVRGSPMRSPLGKGTNKLLTPYQRMCKACYPALKERYHELHLLDLAKMLLRSWNQLSGREQKKYFIPSNEELMEYGHEVIEDVVLVDVWSEAAAAATAATAASASTIIANNTTTTTTTRLKVKRGVNPLCSHTMANNLATSTEHVKVMLSPTPRNGSRRGTTTTTDQSELSPMKRRKVETDEEEGTSQSASVKLNLFQ